MAQAWGIMGGAWEEHGGARTGARWGLRGDTWVWYKGTREKNGTKDR